MLKLWINGKGKKSVELEEENNLRIKKYEFVRMDMKILKEKLLLN